MHYREEKFEKFIKNEHNIYDARCRQWSLDIESGNVYIGGVSMALVGILFIPMVICLFVATPVGLALLAVSAILFIRSSKKEEKAVAEWQKKHGYRIEDCINRHEEFVSDMRAEIRQKDTQLKDKLNTINQALAMYEKY